MIFTGVSPVLARTESSLRTKGSSWLIWAFREEILELMTKKNIVTVTATVIPVSPRAYISQIEDLIRKANAEMLSLSSRLPTLEEKTVQAEKSEKG
jgi:hypothetical protein